MGETVAMKADEHAPIRIVCREATIADVKYLDEGFQQLSAESRYFRFFSAMPIMPESIRAHLIDVDGVRHGAIIALDALAEHDEGVEGKPVGVARWVADRDGTPHLSITVIDEYQGMGVGTQLFEALIALARERGVSHIHADVLSMNGPMKALMRRFGGHIVPNGDPSVVAYDLPLGD
jgi:GNAT superfamily N-acetyltransferase